MTFFIMMYYFLIRNTGVIALLEDWEKIYKMIINLE